MPRRRRQSHSLERVLGTPALFATAYGNVGSSIYYALGVTAAIALGLTPLVFVISGLIFACTAATYAEGTVLFPEAGDYAHPTYWTGLRPSTPSNVPIIGRSRYRNLYLNTGHGTLGWTMGAGSGRALADIISGRTPDVDFRFTN